MLTATNRSNIKISKEIELKRFSEKTFRFIKKFNTIFLYGELGVGKTTFAKYLINNLQEKEKNKITEIPSPTFNLVYEYKIKKLRIQHYDLYRLKNKSEIYNLDIELALRDCTIIEWPEIIEDILPNDRINIYFTEINNTKIEISVRSNRQVKL